MSVVRGMPCSVTSADDQFDNKSLSRRELLNEEAAEKLAVAQIAEQLIDGDEFKDEFSRVKTSFNSVIEELYDDSAWANAIRKLMVGRQTSEAMQEIRDIVNERTAEQAQLIYDDRS